MVRYHFATLGLLLLAFVLQQFVPALSGLSQARVLVVHLVFLCVVLTVGTPMMLLLAFVAGTLWDAHSALSTPSLDPEIYSQPVESLRFGSSIILFAGVGLIMQGLRPLFRAGKWQIFLILSGLGIALYLTIEFLLISFVRGGFIVTRPVLRLIGYSALVTMMASPLVFAVLFWLARVCGHQLFRPTSRS